MQILQLPTDGPFARGRQWYSQFFNPRDKTGNILKNITGKHYVRGTPPWTDSEHAIEAVV